MANIEKIVREEVEKSRPILEKCKSVYFRGTSNFNDTIEKVIKDAHSDNKNFIESVGKNAYFLVYKEFGGSDIRLTIFLYYGFYIMSYTPAFWSNYKFKLIDPLLDDKFIEFEDIKWIKGGAHGNWVIDLKSSNDDFKFRKIDIFNVGVLEESQTKFINLIQNISQRMIEEDSRIDKLAEDFDLAKESQKWDESLIIIDEILNMYPENYYYLRLKSDVLKELGDLDNSSKLLKVVFDKFFKDAGDVNNTKNWSEDHKLFFAFSKQTEAEILKIRNQYIESLRCYNDAIRFTNDEEYKQDLIEARNNTNDTIIKDFKNLKFNLRKVIYLDNELSFYNPSNIIPLEISKVNNLKFPPSHPVAGQLYVGHPFKEEVYFPIEDYENYLFESQVMELGRLLQSLGANKIKTEHITGESIDTKRNQTISNNSNQDTTASASGSGLIYSGEGTRQSETSQSMNTEQVSHNSSQIGKRMNIDGVFKPKIKPFIPDDLIWFEHNEIWQSIAKQRLEGGLESYDILLSTKNVEQVSERELKIIDEEYKLLLKGSASARIISAKSELNTNSEASRKSESLMEMKKKSNTELRIVVEFAPIDDLTLEPPKSNLLQNKKQEVIESVPNSSGYSDAENDYIEEFNIFIEDGSDISEKERKLLNRKREKLGISEERAKEIEDSILNKNQFTQEELDFIEEVNFCLEDDGEIDESEMKMLKRKSVKLGLSEERAKEIINHVVSKKGNL